MSIVCVCVCVCVGDTRVCLFVYIYEMSCCMNLGDGIITLLLSELDLPIVQLLDCARALTTLSGAILHTCVAHAHRQSLNPEPEP